MSNSRYNLYTAIHKGIRSRLCESIVELGRLDDTDTQVVLQQLDKTTDLLILCQQHIEHENQFIHPVLREFQQGQPLVVDEDHHEHQQEIQQMLGDIDHIRSLPALRRRHFLHELYARFTVFVAENLLHMNHEETVCAQVLFDHFNDAEIIAIEQRLVASMPPQEGYESLLLILPNITHSERRTMLLELQQAMPYEVFSGLLQDIKARVSGADSIKFEHLIESELADAYMASCS